MDRAQDRDSGDLGFIGGSPNESLQLSHGKTEITILSPFVNHFETLGCEALYKVLGITSACSTISPAPTFSFSLSPIKQQSGVQRC